MEITKTYSPAEIESKWYQYWLDNKCFNADSKSNKPKYSIVIPPPNVTGVLHMGHMLNNTIQDVLIRKARMDGFEACWIPGTDHASIATEAKVVNMLKEQGVDKNSINREAFLEYAWQWKEKYGGIILEQLKKLGCSCDWDRTRFTMEPDLSDAVTDVFIDLYNKGLIYKGKRMVNWDPQGLTALSDEEVIAKETRLKLYYIQYKIENGTDEVITIATSRPETIMADTAICIHPEDTRYIHLHGKRAIIPLINRSIPIICDDYVDPEFGTGCLKVTPAHDKNDYELGIKHNLPFIDILNHNGTLNEHAQILVNEDRFIARKKIVKLLEAEQALVKTEEYASQVSTSERTGAVVEPKISLQWFVNMKAFLEKNPEVLNSVMQDDIAFYPSKFKNTYKHWLENIKDWCISRQLWWGQRIPAWYDKEGNIAVAKTPNEALQMLQEKNPELRLLDLKQDEDVVDTWFSSWLWPISVFDGFKNPGNDDIKAFYPTAVLVTAPEIIFFWVARMIMAGYEYQKEKPFQAVYFTGIVRDKLGRKMSKSLGNSPDALELIAQYGADGVRMGMLLSSPAGNDLLFDESSVQQGRNFCNKIWNAYRLVENWSTVPNDSIDEKTLQASLAATNWMRQKIATALVSLEGLYVSFRLNEALMTVYKLIWDDFCSWYLEMVKPPFGQPIASEIKTQTETLFVDLLKILHPFMPFITEELYHLLVPNAHNPIMLEHMPKYENKVFAGGDKITELVVQVRNIRNQKNISPKETLALVIQTTEASIYQLFEPILVKLCNAQTIQYNIEKPGNAVQAMVYTDMVYVDLGDKLDTAAEIEKISKELDYLKGFLKSVDAKLANEKFVQNAKPDLVEKEKQKKADAEQKIAALTNNLNALQ